MRRWLPELCALLMLPWLLAQGKRTRRNTPRLPEAAGAREGICLPENPDAKKAPLHLLAIGESPVAGVGVDTQEQGITAQYASQLAAQTHKQVHWRAFGKNGATVADALHKTMPLLMTFPTCNADIVLIAFGVNDTTAFHSCGRYHRDLARLIVALRTTLKPQLLVIAGVPPLHLFPALPQPLRHILGMKAKSLSEVAQRLAESTPQTIFVPIDNDTRAPGLMAYDGYHPSAAGVLVWACQLTWATAAALAESASGP